MSDSDPRRDGGRSKRKNVQTGQALVYGIFLLLASLLALFFLFNTGQLSREKTKLVNTADAVAYSAGLLHARALNFDAYSNRAMIANEVAIAQLVSLTSWARYVQTEGLAFREGLPNASEIASHGLPEFVPNYAFAGTIGETMPRVIDANEVAAKTSDGIVQTLLRGAEDILNASLVPARKALMEEVARANYQGEGSVGVDLVPLQAGFNALDLSLDPAAQSPFVQKYEGDKRTRLAEVVHAAADKDGFVKQRSWTMPGLWPSCVASNGIFWDWISRRGGTEMIGFDEWKAMDTASWYAWRTKGKPPTCVVSENPIGEGVQAIYKERDDDMLNTGYYDSSRIVNPLASLLAQASAQDWKFSGLPAFYDLGEKALGQEDPRLQFAIRLTRAKTETRTSDAAGQVKPSGRLDAYRGNEAADVLAALSASEVFFERPDGDRDNHYGQSLDPKKPREIGSLFNPFWQTHLISPSARNSDTAAGLQGAVSP